MADETATFALKIDADGEPAAEAAAALEKFRAMIEKSRSALEGYRKSQSFLKGSTGEVVDAKAKLRAAIELEKSKISQANLGILKLGGSYDKLAKAQKKGRIETDAGRKAIAAVGGPMKGLLERFDGLKDVLPVLASGWGILAAGIAVGVAAFAIAAASIVDLTLKFTEWLATTADANRNLQLTREAFTGSAKNATNLRNILDGMSETVALTTAQMNQLAIANDNALRGARISGTGIANALHAVAMAAGAGRQDVAAFFNEILQRGKTTGRTFVGPQDFARFRNAGIDVKALYKELGISAAQASRGAVVSTDRMALALRKVSESRFAEINAKKMLSLGSQWDHFKDNLMRLTNDLAGEGGALEPLLKAIAEVAKAFDLTSDSGKALKEAVTKYGKALADAITSHIPDIKAFVLEAIKLTVAFIEGAAAVIKWTQSDAGLTTIKVVLIAIAAAAAAVFVAFLPLIIVGVAIAAAFLVVGLAIYGIYKAVQWIAGLDWGSIGHAIVDGIKNGLEASWEGLKAAVTKMGQGIKAAFNAVLHFGSPSKVFTEYGFNSGAGYQQGIVKAQPGVEAATAGMAGAATSGVEASTGAVASQTAPSSASPASADASPGASGGRSVTIGTIENHFHIPAGKGAEETKAALSSASFLEGFEKSLKALLQAQGMSTGSPAPSGG